MVNIPGWFFGANAVLELVAAVACLLVFYFATKTSKLTKQDNIFFLGLGFFFLGVSFLARTLVHLLFYPFNANKLLNDVVVFFNYGGLFYMALTLAAYLIILAVSMQIGGRKTISLIFLISFIGIFFSTLPLRIFHLISIIVLIYILSHYLLNYTRKKGLNSFLTFVGFFLILVGHVLFILQIYGLYTDYVIYMVAHLVQLGGYGSLLWMITRVLLK